VFDRNYQIKIYCVCEFDLIRDKFNVESKNITVSNVFDLLNALKGANDKRGLER
jgi:hypothetical protein